MKLLLLFFSFLKIGAFSFGGGYAMLPLIREEVITKYNWIHPEEFIDVLAISQMTPGPIAVNSATFIGYKVNGVVGSIVATLAVTLPSFLIVLTIAYFLYKYKEVKIIDWIFKGIRPVVIGLIAAAAITVSKDVFINYKSVIIAGLIFYLISFKKLHPILGIVLSGVLGVILF